MKNSSFLLTKVKTLISQFNDITSIYVLKGYIKIFTRKLCTMNIIYMREDIYKDARKV